jgi:HK97 family phage major capsid protein
MNHHSMMGRVLGQRGLVAVRAQTDTPSFVRDVQAAIEDFKKRHDRRLDDIEASIDDLSVRSAAEQLTGGRSTRPVDPEYTDNFMAWVRGGRREAEVQEAQASARIMEIRNSWNTGSPADGGYLAPTEWDRTITAAQLPVSPMRRLATVRQTGVNAYSTLWNPTSWGSGWVGETAVRPETTTTTFAPVTFGHGEIYANPAVTQRILDDAQINVAEFIGQEIGDEFGRQESVAFVAGNGTNKPFGFLTYATGAANAAAHPGGAIQVTPAASATAITFDELMNALMNLAAPYRQNATWLMNSLTALSLLKLKDAGGNYIWQPTVMAGAPPTLLGYPVEFDENMPNMTTGALPVAIGDFRSGYVINDRTGLRVLRDPYTNKPFVHFYCTKRVGGGVRDPRAIRVIKMA